MDTRVVLNVGGTALHEHKFTYSHGLLGWRCSCKIVRFATRFGLAELNPSAQETYRVSDKKLLWSGYDR